MHVVALTRLPAPDPPMVQALAAALGVTAYEARSRLMVPSGGPTLVARLADGGAAAALLATLRKAGFSALALDTAAMDTDEQRFSVRHIHLTGSGVEVTDRPGAHRSLPFSSIRLILRATGISTGVAVDSQTKRSFSAGRALATGGLMLTKKQTTTTTRSTEDWQAFLVVYPATGSAVVLHESEIIYDGSNAPAQPTRQATFVHIVERLRGACPQARYDDQLMRRAGQLQLLGPSLTPEDHLDVALAVLAATHGLA